MDLPCVQVEIAKDDDDDEELPLTYNPEAIAAYWDRRPVSIITRMLQLLGEGSASYSSSWNVRISFSTSTGIFLLDQLT